MAGHRWRDDHSGARRRARRPAAPPRVRGGSTCSRCSRAGGRGGRAALGPPGLGPGGNPRAAAAARHPGPVRGQDLVPAAGALGLAALAGLAAVLATRGLVRRLVGGLLAVFGVAVVASVSLPVTAAQMRARRPGRDHLAGRLGDGREHGRQRHHAGYRRLGGAASAWPGTWRWPRSRGAGPCCSARSSSSGPGCWSPGAGPLAGHVQPLRSPASRKPPARRTRPGSGNR